MNWKPIFNKSNTMPKKGDMVMLMVEDTPETKFWTVGLKYKTFEVINHYKNSIVVKVPTKMIKHFNEWDINERGEDEEGFVHCQENKKYFRIIN